MEPMTVYAGNDLLDVAMRVAYGSRRDAFRGSVTSRGITYTVDVGEVPVARLVDDDPAHDVVVELRGVVVGVRRGPLDVTRRLGLRATGRLALRENTLSLTGVRVAFSDGGSFDRFVVRVIDERLVPKIADALAAIPIPGMADLFGGHFAPELQSGEVIAGPALRVGASISGASGLAPADPPSPDDLASLAGASGGSALMIGLVSGEAVNVALQELMRPMSHAFDRRGSRAGFGAAVTGTIRATTPVLDVRDGRATARTTVSVAELRGGVRVPALGWAWSPLAAPAWEVVIGHTLTVSGRRGLLTLTGVEAFEASLRWPAALKPVETVAKGLLAGLLSLFRRRIAAAVRGVEIELFELPSPLPGTGGAADAWFDEDGLGYVGSSVRARVWVRA